MNTTLSASRRRKSSSPSANELERKHRRLGQLELGQEGRCLRPSAAAPPSGRRRPSARGGRRRPPGSRPRRRTRGSCRRAAPLRAPSRRRRVRARIAVSTGPSGSGPFVAGRRRPRTPSSPRWRKHRSEEVPDEPVPDDEHACPRGTSRAPRSTHASGSTIVAAGVVELGWQLDPALRPNALGEAAGTDRRRRERVAQRLVPGEACAQAPQAEWWTSATRRPSAVSATTSWPSTTPACAGSSFSTSEPQSPQARTRTSSPGPSGRARPRAPAGRFHRRRSPAPAYRREFPTGGSDGSQAPPLRRHVAEDRRSPVLARAEGARRAGNRVRGRQGSLADRGASGQRSSPKTGQSALPAIELEDGTWWREQSADMAAAIRAGDWRVDPREATICRARGYSSAGRAPGSHPGGQRFEPA